MCPFVTTGSSDNAENMDVFKCRVTSRPDLSPLIRDEDVPDIENFIKRFPALGDRYVPVAIIGEGIPPVCSTTMLTDGRYI